MDLQRFGVALADFGEEADQVTHLESDNNLTIADLGQDIVEQMHVDEGRRCCPHASNVDRQHPLMCILTAVWCLRHPFKVEVTLERCPGELVQGHVSRMG